MNRLLNYDLDLDSPTARGLVGWWPGRFPGGNMLHNMTSYPNNGTWNGTGTHWTTDGLRQGFVGLYNGTDDYVNVGDFDWLTGGLFSLSMWINPRVIAPDGRLFASTTFPGMSLGMQATGRVVIWQTTTHIVAPPGSLVAGTWTHLVIRAETPRQTTAFVDGEQEMTEAVQGADYDFNTPGIGANLNLAFGTRFDGMLDDVRLYNRSLTNAEIRYIYDRGHVAPLSDLAKPVELKLFAPVDEESSSSSSSSISSSSSSFSSSSSSSSVTSSSSSSSSSSTSSIVENIDYPFEASISGRSFSKVLTKAV